MASDSQKRYRGAHDPYNQMEGAQIRPQSIARQDLKNAEKGALSDEKSESLSQNLNRRINNARQANSNINPLRLTEEQSKESQTFRNSVRGTTQAQKQNGRFGKLKKFAPFSLIIGMIFGGGFFFYAAQSMLAPHLSSLVTNSTDLQFTSYSMRNTRLFKYMMDGDGQIKISNFTKKYRTFSAYFKNRLAKNGIEVGKLDADGNFVSTSGLSTSKTVLKYGDEIIDANSFTSKFQSDANFREAYYGAKRGRIAGFFDKSAEKYYKQTGTTRDIFDQYKSTGDENADNEAFEKTVSDRVTGADTSVNTMRTETDDEGNEHNSKNGEDTSTRNIDGDTPETKARSFVNSIAGKVSTVGVPVCSALRIANLASVAVSSFQILQASAYFMSISEPISKTMAGEGDASAINQTLNFLTNTTTTQVNYVNSDGENVTEDVTGSALESAGGKLILGQTKSSTKEIEPYSINNITRAATRIAVGTGVTTTVCSGVMASSAIVSLASNAVPGGKLATIAVGAIMQTVGGIVMTVAVGAIINAIIPYVAKIFASNIFETYTGKPAGELYFLGATSSNGNIAKEASAYMPASEERVKTQNRNTVIALAEEAELDRLNRSPFDITSTNTFLGSILSKFAFMSQSSNLFSSLTELSNIISTSTAKLSPAASAADQELMYTSVYEECDNLKGTVCGIYGLPINSYDYSTIDIAPDDPDYQAAILPNLESDGETIKDGSELAKFITYCVNRESPWGVKDANILNSLQTDGGVVVNNLPIVNDIIDVINAAEDIANEKWATGENCINSADNPRWDNEFKYYQAYVLDMRILSTMDDQAASNSIGNTASTEEEQESNPVLAYEARYAETHPVDNSFEGTLARITGYTKDDIAYLMEVVKYSDFLANYDTSEFFDFNNPNPTPTEISIKTQQNISPDAYFVANKAIFIDKRNYLL